MKKILFLLVFILTALGRLNAQFSINIESKSDITCFGVENGSVSISGNYGVRPYMFALNGSTFDTAARFDGLNEGYHTIIAKDSNNARDTLQFIITSPKDLTYKDSIIQANCPSEKTFSVFLNGVSGGTGKLKRSWVDFDKGITYNSNNLIGVTQGVYQLTISDANNCKWVDTLILSPIYELKVSGEVGDITCYDQTDGKISLTINNANRDYSLLWNGPNGFQDSQIVITGLDQGFYSYYVEDDSTGCFDSAHFFIQRPSKINLKLKSKRDLFCHNDSSGLISLEVNGGTKPFIFNWEGPGGFTSTSQNIKNASKGTYRLSFSDIQGCSDSLEVTLSQPDRLLLASNVQNISCYGASNGSISLTANGGLPPYQYTWSNGRTGSKIANLSSGNYQVNIKDSNNCLITKNINVTSPDKLQLEIPKKDISCFGRNDGQFTIVVTGGSFPFTYNVEKPDGDTISIISKKNASPGNYKISVIDSKGCGVKDSVFIIEPDELKANAIGINPVCYGSKGSLKAIVDGGIKPYSFQWLDSFNTLYSATQNVISADSGLYFLTVNDKNSCFKKDTIKISAPPQLILILDSLVRPSCAFDSTGEIKISSKGGVKPYDFSINKYTINQTGLFDKLKPGKYLTTVKDSNQCSANLAVTLTRLDTTRPKLKLKIPTFFLDDNGNCTINTSDIDDGSYDNCGISSFTIEKTQFTCTDTGLQKLRIALTDLSSNTTRDTIQITIRDSTPPKLLVKNTSVFLDNSGKGSINISDVDIGSSDNCKIKSFHLSRSNFDCSDSGLLFVQIKAIDYAGNISVDTVTVNILDTIKPVIKYKNLTAYLNSTGFISIKAEDFDIGSTDNCGIARKLLSRDRFSCLNIGSNFVTYSVIDKSGNTSTQLVEVIVKDTISPNVRTKTARVYLNDYGFGVLNPRDIDSNSFDNCKISSKVIGQSVFTCNDLGSNTTSLTCIDASGNNASANAKIIVVDTIFPVINTRNPILYLDFNGQAVLSAFDADKGSYDNCGISKISVSKDKFNCHDLGIQDIIFSATDVSGNTSTGIVKVFVSDTMRPKVLVRNKDLYLDDSGSVTVKSGYFDVGTNDNCAIKSQSLSKYKFYEEDLGSQVLLFNAVDSSDNSSFEVLTFKVRDTIAPIVNIPKQTRFLDGFGRAYVKVQEISNGIKDNISIQKVNLSDSVFTCADLGVSEVNVTVTDIAGNRTKVPVLLDIKDTIKPMIFLKDATLEINTSGKVVLNVESVIDSIVENCAISRVNLSRRTFDINAIGENYVQVSVIDESGNISLVKDVKVVVIFGDRDKDSIPDYLEGKDDFDGDGIPNFLDQDSDNDGVLDVVENDGLDVLLDLDQDGLKNIFDLDSDNDGIFDILEVNGFDVEPYDGLVGIGVVTVNNMNGIPVLANANKGFLPVDSDLDNVMDFKDLDSDDDDIPDEIERGPQNKPIDTDNDAIPDYRDEDSDSDEISDKTETFMDRDQDGIANYLDKDADNDGILDFIESAVDKDGDGWGNWIDFDSDGDGILDIIEGSVDYDLDGIGNWLDLDSDGDFILDSIEGEFLTDYDKLQDFLDEDSDNDFILDSVEAMPLVNGIPMDTDGDGVFDFRDIDSDGDGLSDDYEGSGDVDNDGIPNFRDLDSDDDGISDFVEGTGDLDGDGIPNNIDSDSDGDGIPDAIETNMDSDGDNVPNCWDLDSDNDGLNDLIECGYYDTFGIGLIHPNDKLDSADIHRDSDKDGVYNFLDLDSDGDGISDLDEGWYYEFDRNYDGIIDGFDSDGDGIKDYVDNFNGIFGDYYDYPAPDSDYDGIADFEDFDSDDDGILDEIETIEDQDFDFISNYLDEDSDGDKLLDKDETDADFDLDGIPNFLDEDSDNDGIQDSIELDSDFDGDGQLNYLDPDADNDGMNDKFEGLKDEDKNGVPDYLDPQIFVPEIFTPNGDGVNDFLILKGLENYPKAYIIVFNQWGQVVFNADGPYQNDWGGNMRTEELTNSQILPEGVYFYIVYYNRNDLKRFKKAPFKGNLYIKPSK